MLQQTQVNTVLPYYKKFLKQFPNPEKLARADLQSVLKVWEGMGYYARARNIHRAAKVIRDQNGGKLPATWEEFRQLPGVGEYIAAAVLSIAFGQPYAVVDGNVKRVLVRLFRMDTPVNVARVIREFRNIADKLLDQTRPGLFNQAVMELGAIVCKPKNPLCPFCPLQDLCRSFRAGRVTEYPKKKRVPSKPEYPIAIGVVFRDNRVLITQRKPEGLLGGLWEFPGGKIREGESAEAACIREIKEEVNLRIDIDTYLTQVKHAYTHFKIIMEVFRCRSVSGRIKLNGPVAYRWIGLDDIDRYPFPKANHKFIPLLK